MSCGRKLRADKEVLAWRPCYTQCARCCPRLPIASLRASCLVAFVGICDSPAPYAVTQFAIYTVRRRESLRKGSERLLFLSLQGQALSSRPLTTFVSFSLTRLIIYILPHLLLVYIYEMFTFRLVLIKVSKSFFWPGHYKKMPP